MNTRPRVRRFPTAAVAAVTLMGAVILLTACGSSSGDKTAPAAGQEQALAFARCIRSNGVPDFPDPDANGQFRGVAHEQEGNPRFQAAQEACRDLAPGGEHENLGDPAFVEQAREFAQCIRANGVPDFPDPDAAGRFLGASHEQESDPKLRAAMEVCRQKLPGGGNHQ
jgi:hypothetical protein